MPNPDVSSWTRLQSLYLNRKMPTKALGVFLELIRSDSVKPDSHSIVATLSACARSKDIRSGRIIHGKAYKYLREPNPNVDNALIDMYGKNKRIDTARRVFSRIDFKDVAIWTTLLNGYLLNGDIETAKQVFDEMPQRNIFSWTAMIVGYVRNSKPVEALELFMWMQHNSGGEHCDPTTVTIVALLSGCADIGALNLGSSIHGYINKRMGFAFNLTINNGLIDMYAKSGSLESAVRLFESMRRRDLFSWTSMISGLALNGSGRHALVVFDSMEEYGIIPNEVTFLSVLSACSHSGLVLEGERLFEKFVCGYHVKPQIQHYGCMVDLFVRAGCLEKAMEFIRRMPVKADAMIWRSLLYGACSGDEMLELAELAGKKAIELDPGDDSVYVLLSSIYRSRKRWNDAMRVMQKMRDGRIKKTPGCSWIEVNGVVYEFLAEGFSASGSPHYSSDSKNNTNNTIMLVLNWIFQHLKLDNTGHDNDTCEVLLQ